jgi:flagellar protein FlaJ
MVCLASFIGYFITLIILSVLNVLVFKLSILVSVLVLVLVPFVVAALIFIAGIFYPYQKLLSRRKSITTNLPFAISHMGAIASSGVPPQVIFKLLAEFKEYDALAEEMEKIARNVEVFGMDPISAMREVAKRTPSEKFKQLLLGLASTIESGGDLKTYLKNAGEQSLFTWRMKRQKYLQQLSSYAEFYTGLLIAAPLFLIALFSVMHMIQPELGGFDILQLMKISIYLVIPALNLGFLTFLEVTQVEM